MSNSKFSKTTVGAVLFLLLGLLTLAVNLPFVPVVCLVIGIVMLIEQRWPEKWGEDSQNETDE